MFLLRATSGQHNPNSMHKLFCLPIRILIQAGELSCFMLCSSLPWIWICWECGGGCWCKYYCMYASEDVAYRNSVINFKVPQLDLFFQSCEIHVDYKGFSKFSHHESSWVSGQLSSIGIRNDWMSMGFTPIWIWYFLSACRSEEFKVGRDTARHETSLQKSIFDICILHILYICNLHVDIEHGSQKHVTIHYYTSKCKGRQGAKPHR